MVAEESKKLKREVPEEANNYIAEQTVDDDATFDMVEMEFVDED